MRSIKLVLIVLLAAIATAASESWNNIADIGEPENRFQETNARNRNREVRQVSQPHHRIPRPIPRPGLVARLSTTSLKPETTTESLFTVPTATSQIGRFNYPRRPGVFRPITSSLSIATTTATSYLPNAIIPDGQSSTSAPDKNPTPEYVAEKEEVTTASLVNPSSTIIENDANSLQTTTTMSTMEASVSLPDTSFIDTSTISSNIIDNIFNSESSQAEQPTTIKVTEPISLEPISLPKLDKDIANELIPSGSETIIVPKLPTVGNPSTTFRYNLPPRYPNRFNGLQPTTTAKSYVNEPAVIPTSTEIIQLKPKLPISLVVNPSKLGDPYDYNCKPGIHAFYSVPDECDSYIECKKNLALKYVCPDGLHFNPKAVWPDYPCAYPSEVKCRSNSLKQNPQPTAECPRQYGFFARNDGACDSFIMCEGGKATVVNCPAGLAYNPLTTSCDWLANVPTCNLNVFKGFECPAPPVDEFGTPSDIIYNYRYGSSCKQYVACQSRRPRLLSCDPGLSFDDSFGTCVDSDLVQGCAS